MAEDLVATLVAKSAEIDERLEALEPQILAAQEQLQLLAAESDRLIRARDLSRDTYMTLARKLEEARISIQEADGIVRVGSHAAVPSRPVGSRRLFNTIAAALLGLVIGILVAFAIEFWHRNGQEGAGDREQVD